MIDETTLVNRSMPKTWTCPHCKQRNRTGQQAGDILLEHFKYPDGNSIALPFWFWLLRRISAQYERPATLGSLFDGIGGFPLCWERCNGKGTALWASEIDPYCIAVCKKHFGDSETGEKGNLPNVL